MNNKWILGGITGVALLAVFFFQNQNSKLVSSSNTSVENGTRELANIISEFREFGKSDYEYKGAKKTLDSHILDLKSPDDIIPLAKYIVAWDKKFNPVTDGKRIINRELLRMYAMTAEYIPLAKGLVYRLREVAQEDIAFYAMALMGLRETKYVSSETPSHINAAFDYLTTPNPYEEVAGRKGLFKNINEVIAFFIDKVAPRLENSIEELEEVIVNGELNRPVIVSNLALSMGQKIADGIRNEPANSKIAFDKIVLAHHLYGAKAAVQSFLASAYYMASFNIEGSHIIANQMVKQIFMSRKTSGFSEFIGIDLVGWNNLPSPKEAKQFVNEVRNKKKTVRNKNRSGKKRERVLKYGDFLKLKKNHFLSDAKKFFKEANESDYIFHKALIDMASEPGQKTYIVDASIYGRHSHAPMEVINIRKKLFNTDGNVEIKNFTTNKKIEVNINAFFDPEVVTDLVSFMPTKFNLVKEFQGRKEMLTWNYLYGRSEFWPKPKFGGLLPNGQQNDVRQNLATIYQHPALAFIIPVMTLFR